jgi:hypothetical protein
MRGSAALAVAAALTVIGVAPASGAAAARPRHVAIVIGGHGVACVPWHSGITGDEILNDVATVKYRPTDGLITQIDGTPKNNTADETHYWSYWHNTGSGWRYSTTGAGAYQPKAGTVEGWHFINGSSTATPPAARSYSSICHDTDAAAPAPPPPSKTTTPAAHSPATTHPANTTHPAMSATSPTPHPGARNDSGSGAPASAATATTRPATSSSTPVPSTSAAAAAGPATDLRTLAVRNTADATPRTDAGSAVPTVLVVTIVLLLGGAAALVAQRRRRSA